MTLELLVRSGRRAGERVILDGVLLIGRTAGDLRLVDDDLVSGRHARITLRPDGIAVLEDLQSRNGTFHNGRRVDTPTAIRPGDRFSVGDTVLEVCLAPASEFARPASETVQSAAEPARLAATEPNSSHDSPGPQAAPLVAGFAEKITEHGTIAYRPGTFGASIAAEATTALAAAHEHLAPLIALTGELRACLRIVDPFPDPASPGHMVTRGSVVDTERGEIWLAVSAESPLEPLERPLALLLGARLAAAAELASLLEGYGLCAGGAPDPAAHLRDSELPPLAAAEGELATAMARSFVGFLVARAGEETFLRFLEQARPGRIDQTARAVLGQPLGALEETWRSTVRGQAGLISTSRFVRLALSYLRPYWRRELELVLLSLLSLTFIVTLPFALEALFNHAIPSGKFSDVATILVILAAAIAISVLATWRQNYLTSHVGASIARDVRLAIFDRLQQLELGWFAQRDSGDLLTRLVADVDLLQRGLSQAMGQAVVQGLAFVCAGIVAMVLNLWLGLLLVVAGPMIAVVYRLMSAGAQRRSRDAQQQLGGLASIATENLSAQQVVKAFGLEQRESSRLREACDALFGSALRLSVFTGAFSATIQLLTSTLSLLVLALGAWLVINHHFTVGGLVGFTTIIENVLSPATVLASVGAQIQASSGALLRINEVLETVPRTHERNDAVSLPRLEGKLELREVSFSYTPERQVLSSVGAEISAGARVAFVGPSGAGKSSIVGLLLRFADPDSGSVLFDGVDLRDVTLSSLRNQIGVVMQQTFLFNTTIRENIALSDPEASADQIDLAVAGASLDEVLVSLPAGLDTVVGERGGRLSGGQAQRVAIARALLRDPAIIVLDEATSALDPRTEREVCRTLERVGAGRTTIAVTHRLASVRDYDCIFVVVDGRIVQSGTHAELLAAGGAYAELWAEQTSGVAPPGEDLGVGLARIPMLADLDPEELSLVQDTLEPLVLRHGERLSEESRRLAIVAQGTGRVLVPGVGGEGLVRVAELRPGQAFGLSALLGEPTGSVLEASGPLSLLCLDAGALERLAERIPALCQAQRRNQATVISPVRGRRLGFTGSFAASRLQPVQSSGI